VGVRPLSVGWRPIIPMQLTRSQIPPAIVTVEQLVVWGAMCLSNANLKNTFKLNFAGDIVNAAQVQLSPCGDGSQRFCIQAYIPYSDVELNAAAKKAWLSALELGTSAPHQNYLSD
jgi:hypothetical protein